MKIRCRTNLDLHPCEKFPEELPCRPMVGDIITSSTGLELQVVRITFKEVRLEHWHDNYGVRYGNKEIVAITELHLIPTRFENITQFEEWYKNRDRRSDYATSV